MTISRLFARQLKSVFPDRNAAPSDDLDTIVQKILNTPNPEQLLIQLLSKVETSYARYDRDLQLSSASLRLSFKELEEVNSDLQQKSQIQQELIDSLRGNIRSLLETSDHQDQVESFEVQQLPELFASLLQDNQKAKRELEFQKYALDQHAIVSTTDSQGRITYANEKFCDISGFQEHELLGKTHSLVKSGEHDGAFYADMWQTITAGRVWHGEIKNRKHGGGYYWVAASIVPILNERGVPEQYVSIRTDISERKEMEQTLRKEQLFLEKLADTLGEGVYALDDKGRCIFVNQTAERILGWSKEEMLGQLLHNLIHYKTPDGVSVSVHDCPISHRNRCGEKFFSDNEYFIHRDGHGIPIEVASVPLTLAGESPGAVAVFKDITQRKQDEKAKQEALERAESATQAKSAFLANMSHEIRTPMNAIIGLSHLMQSTTLDKSQRNYLSKIQSSSSNLLNIINDILDFSKIEAGKLDVEHTEFELDELLQSVYDVNEVKAHEKGLMLAVTRDFQIPPRLLGDVNRIKQILTNLLSNAIKFTEQGKVAIDVQPLVSDGENIKLEFCVSDTGIGINKQYQKTLFQPFTQADASTTRKYGGTGLGLTITHQLTELLGGSIRLQSEQQKGSRFWVSLPLQVAASTLERKHILQGVNVLQIGSDEQLERFLSGLGMNRQVYPYGREQMSTVQDALQNDLPDCILLLDQANPDDTLCDYLDTLGQQNPRLYRIPVVVYSTPAIFAQVQKRVEHFALYGFSEICTPSALVNSLHEALHPQHTDPDLHQQVLADDDSLPLAGARILLAEDNPINTEVAKGLLDKLGVSTTTVGDGRAAIACLEQQHYDLVLMDLQMPVLDGHAATVEIRNNPHFDKLPIIALTAHAMSGDFERSLAIGMNGHITKPIDPAELKATLLKWINPTSRHSDGVTTEDGTLNTEHNTAALNQLPGLEWRQALDRVGGDMPFYLSLWDMFDSNFSGLTARFADVFAQADPAAIKQFAHSIKGVAANLGANELMALAREIELSEQISSAEAEAYLVQIAEAEARLNASVAVLRSQDKPAVVQDEATTVLEELFPKLRSLLQSGDTEVLEYVHALEEQNASSPQGPLCQKLATLIADFEFDEALKLLES